jgi:hypothetical protein
MVAPDATALPKSIDSERSAVDSRRWLIVVLLASGAIIAFCARTNISAALAYRPFAIVAILVGWAADTIIKRGADAVFVRKAFVIAGFAIASTEIIGVNSSTVQGALFWAVASFS